MRKFNPLSRTGLERISNATVIQGLPWDRLYTKAEINAIIANVKATAGAVQSVNGKTGVVSLVKADIGLGNVDNTADAAKTFDGSQITAGTVAPGRLGSGTPSASNFLRGDSSWAVPAGGGSTPRASIDFLFNTDTTSAGTRQQVLNSGSASTALASGGYQYSTGATAGSVSRGLLNNTILKIPFFDRNPAIFFGAVGIPAEGGDYDIVLYCGGSGGPPATTTSVHFGFRFNRTSGVDTVFATNANGGTETATDITALVSGASIQKSLYAVMTSGTNIKYYYDGTLVATHTTNLPSANPTLVASQWGIINNAAANSILQLGSVSLGFDLN